MILHNLNFKLIKLFYFQGRYHKLRPILTQYSQSGNEETAYQALVLNSHWGRAYLMRKNKRQLEALQEHVKF